MTKIMGAMLASAAPSTDMHIEARPIISASNASDISKGVSNIEKLIVSYNQRGVRDFHVPGQLEKAASALALADRVVICTGFNVAHEMPETDGPPGAAVLANALARMGKSITVVTDTLNQKLVAAAMNVLNPEKNDLGIRFISFDEKDGYPAEQKARKILGEAQPQAVVVGELTGRNDEGIRKNMRGVNINDFNAAVDEVLVQANLNNTQADQKHIATVAIGDGGNEAGMGGLHGIPNALDGSKMQAKEHADFQVTASVSNWGFEALATSTSRLQDNPENSVHILPTPDQTKEIIKAVLENGAVDGVTRGDASQLDKVTTDAKGAPVSTGVDGFSSTVHAGMTEMIRNLAHAIPRKMPLIGVVAQETAAKNAPIYLAAFDSSDGVYHALPELVPRISNEFPNAKFLVLADHINAPYGDLTQDQITQCVRNALTTAADLGVKKVIMACNTACTAFDPHNNTNCLDADEFKKNTGVEIINLIKNTANAVVEKGGLHPVILATPATKKSGIYEREIKSSASEIPIKKQPRPTTIGCGDFAKMVNEGYYLPGAGQVKENKLRLEVAKHVSTGSIPKDATSVWLCCTHYPALKKHIEQRLDEIGLGHIKVLNPMEFQAGATIHAIKNTETDSAAAHVEALNGMGSAKLLQISTNKRSQVSSSIKHMPLQEEYKQVHARAVQVRHVNPNESAANWRLSAIRDPDEPDSDVE